MGIRTGTLRRAAAGAALLAVLVAGMPAPGRAAADSLVLAALHTLETSYVEPVDAPALLDAAIAALRQATGLGEDLLPGIPPGTGAAQATAAFSSAFDRAIAAGRLDPRHLAFAATAGMLASLHDSHTYFLDPARFREEQETLRGAAGYSGIGVLLASVDDGTGGRLAFVAYVFPGSPAARAGLRRFDRIVGVDGWPLRRASVEELVRALRGPVGTPVALSVRRGDRVFDVQVTRAPIRIPPVDARAVTRRPWNSRAPGGHPRADPGPALERGRPPRRGLRRGRSLPHSRDRHRPRGGSPSPPQHPPGRGRASLPGHPPCRAHEQRDRLLRGAPRPGPAGRRARHARGGAHRRRSRRVDPRPPSRGRNVRDRRARHGSPRREDRRCGHHAGQTHRPHRNGRRARTRPPAGRRPQRRGAAALTCGYTRPLGGTGRLRRWSDETLRRPAGLVGRGRRVARGESGRGRDGRTPWPPGRGSSGQGPRPGSGAALLPAGRACVRDPRHPRRAVLHLGRPARHTGHFPGVHGAGGKNPPGSAGPPLDPRRSEAPGTDLLRRAARDPGRPGPPQHHHAGGHAHRRLRHTAGDRPRRDTVTEPHGDLLRAPVGSFPRDDGEPAATAGGLSLLGVSCEERPLAGAPVVPPVPVTVSAVRSTSIAVATAVTVPIAVAVPVVATVPVRVVTAVAVPIPIPVAIPVPVAIPGAVPIAIAGAASLASRVVPSVAIARAAPRPCPRGAVVAGLGGLVELLLILRRLAHDVSHTEVGRHQPFGLELCGRPRHLRYVGPVVGISRAQRGEHGAGGAERESSARDLPEDPRSPRQGQGAPPGAARIGPRELTELDLGR